VSTGVLFVGNFLSEQRGHRHYCEDLAHRVAQDGWSVVRTSFQSSRARKLLDMVLTAWRDRRDYAVANVDVYSGFAFGWAEVVATELRQLKKPFVLSLHGGNLPEFARRWPRRVRRLLGEAGALTSPSSYLRDALAAYTDREIVVIPNGLDLRRTTFLQRSRPRKKLLWLRAFHRVYNPTMAVEVLAALRANDHEYSLVMVGPDRGDGSLADARQRATRLGVQDAITFVGPIPNSEVPRYLREADVFINTTNADNTPVSVLEAMASGMIVVSTRVGGIPHLVQHDIEALLVPPGDAPEMASSVRRVVENSVVASRLSAAAHERAARADWTAVLPRWNTLLTELAARG
jgi:glycosyltransferase involved in cell wall biosynthesis